MGQKSKIFKIPLRFEKKTLKPAQVRSLSKIVQVFVIVVIKSEVLLFQLPRKVDSTVIVAGYSKYEKFNSSPFLRRAEHDFILIIREVMVR